MGMYWHERGRAGRCGGAFSAIGERGLTLPGLLSGALQPAMGCHSRPDHMM